MSKNKKIDAAKLAIRAAGGPDGAAMDLLRRRNSRGGHGNLRREMDRKACRGRVRGW